MRTDIRRSPAGALVVLALGLIVALGAVGEATASFEGTLRVYVVEPESRWLDRYGGAYAYGFLDFAMISDLSLSDSIWQGTSTWSAATAGFSGVTQNNSMVIAVLFSNIGEQRDAAPPLEVYYTSYPVQAAAAATPGNPGSNLVSEGYTHTVFIEEGTATT